MTLSPRRDGGLVQAFIKDRRANTAMMFAIMLLPLLVVAGATIDFARQSAMKSKAQSAIDAAILQAALQPENTNNNDLTAGARAYFDAEMGGDLVVVDNFSVKRVGDTFQATMSGSTDATLLGLIGISALPLSASSEVKMSERKFEVALALDTTGSMTGNKLANLKTSANQLVDRLSTATTASDGVKFAVVPFAATVRVGSGKEAEQWMDDAGKSKRSADNLIPNVNRFALMKHLKKDWTGCVEARLPPYDVTDEVATNSDPDTLFAPVFVPDDLDNKWMYPNTYVNDVATWGTMLDKIGNVKKYGINSTADAAFPNKWSNVSTQTPYKFFVDSNNYSGPNSLCESEEVLPLTTSVSKTKAKIGALTAAGSTNTTEGIMWAWRMLSHGAPFSEGAPKSNKNVDKIIVLLSDGNNHVNYRSDARGSDYFAYGYINNGNLPGAPAGATQQQIWDAMDARTLEACSNAKADGVTIYTIRLELADSRSDNLLRGCASSDSHYLDVPDADQLDAAFAKISNDILQLYLSK
ncbi:MAG: TadE/TadG family type IV pilus assembly protein [Hyphomonas sp.]|uniref:pilus assembly protein TadG-related protein n=1 Tax=Hyphomonas sp. TaxID=87 RepID=UPI003527E5FE